MGTHGGIPTLTHVEQKLTVQKMLNIFRKQKRECEWKDNKAVSLDMQGKNDLVKMTFSCNVKLYILTAFF